MAQDKFQTAIDLDKRLQDSRWETGREGHDIDRAPKSPSSKYAGFLRLQTRGEYPKRRNKKGGKR